MDRCTDRHAHHTRYIHRLPTAVTGVTVRCAEVHLCLEQAHEQPYHPEKRGELSQRDDRQLEEPSLQLSIHAAFDTDEQGIFPFGKGR